MGRHEETGVLGLGQSAVYDRHRSQVLPANLMRQTGRSIPVAMGPEKTLQESRRRAISGHGYTISRAHDSRT